MTAVAVDASPTVIADPGVYTLPEDIYHGDPVPGGSLSVSGAKKLLPPSCPAKFRHDQLHGQAHKRTFDFGHAVHLAVLGVGAEVVVVDAPDWRGKAAREQRDVAYTDGHTPILAADAARAETMAGAVRAHQIAGALFAAGEPERSLFWPDTEHDVMRRARLDWITEHNGRTLVVDLKTCDSAAPGKIARAVDNYRYHCQSDWYLDGVRALGLAADPAFLFVFVEKDPPHVVTVCELDGPALAVGAHLNQQALRTYARCVAADTWPGYTDDIPVISLPPWALTNLDLDMENS